MVMRLRYVKQGGHYHCRLFTGVDEDHLQKSGDLVFNEQEWNDVSISFQCGGFEVLPEVER